MHKHQNGQHFSHAANQRISQTTTDNSYWSYPPATAATTVYTSNNLDQYTAIGSVSPAYDGNGNLTLTVFSPMATTPKIG